VTVAQLAGFLFYPVAIVVFVLWIRAGSGETQHSAVASGFVGHWSGTITQIGHGKPLLPRALLPRNMVIGGNVLDFDAAYKQLGPEINTTYPVTMFVRPGEISDPIGTSSTPDCGGDLILRSSSPAQISVEERLTKGSSACTDHDKITLRLRADGTLEYYAEVAALGLSASAILRKKL
jgi:hypothetical protein